MVLNDAKIGIYFQKRLKKSLQSVAMLLQVDANDSNEMQYF